MKNRLLLLIVISFVSGCFKPVGTYNHLSTAMLTDFNFKQGSYWIYRDSLSGRMDSVFVSQHDSGTNSTTPHDPTEAVHTDYIDIGLSGYSASSGTISADSIYWGFNLYPNALNIVYTRYNPNLYPGVAMGDGILDYNASYPFTASTSGDSCGWNTSSILSSLTVNNQEFKNVGYLTCVSIGCIRQHYSVPALAFSDEIYICPKVGIIKLSVKHPLDSVYRVWELVRYNVRL